MAKRKHTHQYQKSYPWGIRNAVQWECALPDCSHYLPKNCSEPDGKLSICHGCMSEFVLDEENMKYDKPVCATCSNPITDGDIINELELERHMIRSTIATRTGRALEEVSESEVDRMVQFNKLKNI